VNFTALRESKILQELKHPNIIELKDVFIIGEGMYLVMDFMPWDLVDLIYPEGFGKENEAIQAKATSIMLKEIHVKCIMH
jgi:serine/threonine protein kinase